MLAYCTISGFAGVYTEIVLQRQPALSYFEQGQGSEEGGISNSQPPPVPGLKLYLFGMLFTGLQAAHAGVWTLAGPAVRGIDGWTCIVIATQAANGLLYGVIMKVGAKHLPWVSPDFSHTPSPSTLAT